MSYYNYVDLSDLNGKTITKVSGLEVLSDSVIFHTSEGCSYEMYHDQDCCEYVRIEDLDGDEHDLVDGLVLSAEEVSGFTPNYKGRLDDSYTWTFYKIHTTKGSVWIRWLGESNGYYSESVSFRRF